MTRTGGCLCGAIRFEARGEPYRVGLCHCMTCRKVHGAPFHAFTIFPLDAVTITGEPASFATSEHGRRCFCPRCGAHVFMREDDTDEIELHLGSFDEPDLFRPGYELWVGRRESWLPAVAPKQYPGNREGTGRTE